MTQTYSIKDLYPLELSLTHDYHPLTPELEETEKDTPPTLPSMCQRQRIHLSVTLYLGKDQPA